MGNILIKQARINLESFKDENKKIKLAAKILEELDKESAGLADIINNPLYQNVVNILGPYAIYYKIDQVLKLLQELEKGTRKSPYYARPL